MKYLSIDIESTGLKENCQIIEFALVAFDTSTQSISDKIQKNYQIKCPSLAELKDTIDPWVYENMGNVITNSHNNGMELDAFKTDLINYLTSKEVTDYFSGEKIVLFGKSLSAIDLPFLKRDLGWEVFNKIFSHRNLDLSCFCYSLIDLGVISPEMSSGEKLMKHFNLGAVAHTAMEDATNTIILYFKLLDMAKSHFNKN